MSDQTLNFSSEPKVPTIEDLVGEGKKYASLEEAVGSIPHAQTHISKLEAEAAELRAELEKRTTVQEQLKALSESTDPNKAKTQPEVEVKVDDTPRMGEEEVLGIIQQYEAGKSAERNVTMVTETLSKVFGSDAESKFKDKANDLGVSVEDLSALARKSPKAVLAYFDIKEASAPTKTTGSVNPESLSRDTQPPARKTVMGGATSQDVSSAWEAIKAEVMAKY